VVEIASLLIDLPSTFTLVEANRRFLFRGTYSAQVRSPLALAAVRPIPKHVVSMILKQTNGKAPKSSELLLFSDVVIQVRPRMLSKQLKFVAMLWIRASTCDDSSPALTPFVSFPGL
jgi:hypothetical protein